MREKITRAVIVVYDYWAIFSAALGLVVTFSFVVFDAWLTLRDAGKHHSAQIAAVISSLDDAKADLKEYREANKTEQTELKDALRDLERTTHAEDRETNRKFSLIQTDLANIMSFIRMQQGTRIPIPLGDDRRDDGG